MTARRIVALLATVVGGLLLIVVAGAVVVVAVFGTTDAEAWDELDLVRTSELGIPLDHHVVEEERSSTGRGFCALGPDCGTALLVTVYAPTAGATPLTCEGLARLARPEAGTAPAATADGTCAVRGEIANGSGYVDPIRWRMVLGDDGRLRVSLGGPVIVP